MITLVIGSDTVGSDGYRGEVLAAVIDPARTVTHIVVEPKGRQGLAPLVPLDLVDASPDLVRLACTEAHVLVREGHLWDRKDVAIPFEVVAGFDDGVRLSITRQQVRDLPSA